MALILILRPCSWVAAPGGFGKLIVNTPSLNCAEVRIYLVRDRQCPLEGAVGSFHAVHQPPLSFFLFIVLGSLFALYAELITNQRYVDIALLDPR